MSESDEAEEADEGSVTEIVEAEADPSAPSSEKLQGRKKRVVGGYKLCVFFYGLFGALLASMSKEPFYGAGPFLASGVAYNLIGAAENDRLSSATYKRLNLALGTYAFVGFFAGLIMNFRLWSVASFVAFVNSVKGYGYGLKGWELAPTDAVADLRKGLTSDVRTLLRLSDLRAAGYAAAAATVLALTLAKLAELRRLAEAGDAYAVGTRLFRLSKLLLAAATAVTLKDAADRGRLEGTTFVRLNFFTAVFFATWARYEGAGAALGKGFASFAAFAAFNGISSVLKKRRKEQAV